uniref:Uncharacterized protein n=1 Tax=Candidatus Kentrum sp. UNK TaxID=2126344 RepID=A0A451AQG4_9GAMM|nr:MAG: hypothetical protein BECKUNK1418G_GA0071005_100237 [Candidatus Kentron sp. UNK]VFK68301.1 MAG: hypothetical protein BECKUNK1418H_GA0071006_100137 [Candidatus Kentron sp. UNK]
MGNKAKKKILLAKVETTYGTDPTPDGGNNAILISDVTISPMEGETKKRKLVNGRLGNELALHVGTHIKLEFDVEVAGSGAAGTAPAYGPLLHGCALVETVTPSEKVEYEPVSDDEKSVTLYFYLDGALHKVIGARGTMGIKIKADEIPYFHFVFTGLWVDPAAETNPTGDFTAFQDPLPVTNSDTTFTMGGASAKLYEFECKQENVVKYLHRVGLESVEITNHTPNASVTIDAPPLGTKNWFTDTKGNNAGALQLVHGKIAGNIVQFDFPKAQPMKPAYGEQDGFVTIKMDLNIIPESGDDDFKITVK